MQVMLIGKKHLVLDLSCRKRGDHYYVVTDRWQKFSSLQVNEATLASLASSCDEFLVHGVDVEGMKLGIDEELVSILGKYSPIPVTYAGGATTLVRASGVALLATFHDSLFVITYISNALTPTETNLPTHMLFLTCIVL